MTAAREIARALGGEVVGRNILLCPGPGHSPKDRSLQVTLDARAPDGIVVHSTRGEGNGSDEVTGKRIAASSR